MAINRAFFSVWVDDDGSNTTGMLMTRAHFTDLLDAVDAAIAAGTPGAGSITNAMLAGAITASKLVGTDLVLTESQITALVADLAAKAALASPALTGTPTAPTAAPGTNTTQIATTAFSAAAITAAVGALTEASIPSLVSDLAAKAPLASPALTGTPTAPTAAPGTNTTQLATTAFATAADALKAPLASPSFTGTVTAAGLVDLSGAAAGQIKFPAAQDSSANVNTFDDYEEGTWTPTLGGSGGTSGQSYGVRTGVYTKIGNAVVLALDVTLSAKGTITGNVEIQGIPFACNATQAFMGAISWNGLATNWVNMIGYVAPGASTIQVFGTVAAGASTFTALTTTDIANSSLMRMTFIYTAAT